MKTIISLLFTLFTFSLSAQVFINRDAPISSAEVFGMTKALPRFGSTFGGMYIETTGNNAGKPFYGYAMDGQIKAYQYFSGQDQGLHLYALSDDKMSIWEDSMQWRINNDLRLFYDGYKLEFGDNGNTFLGKGVTPSTSTTNTANTVVGWLGGMSMTGGVNNTLIGFRNAQLLSSGDWNTIVGSEAANKLTTGYRNTIIGYRAGWNGAANGFGNILIGNRAGEGQAISNKLIISNSETTTPLIEGDFASPELKINGDARVTGATQIDGLTQIFDNANVFGNMAVTGNTNSGTVNLTAANPYLDFKPGGSSKFYIQYDQTDDELNIHRTGLGDVVKIKNDGSIYMPELATSEKATVEIMPDGKLVLKTYPIIYEYYKFEEKNNPFSVYSDFDLIPANDLRDGDVLTQMVIRSFWNSTLVSNPTQVALFRWDKFNGNLEAIAGIGSLPIGPHNQEFSISMNHTVDLGSYAYFLLVDKDSSYTYIRLKR